MTTTNHRTIRARGLAITRAIALTLALVLAGAAAPAAADDTPDADTVRAMIADAVETKKALEERLLLENAEVRDEVDKPLRPVDRYIKRARRDLAEGKIEPAFRRAEDAIRSLRSAESRLEREREAQR